MSFKQLAIHLCLLGGSMASWGFFQGANGSTRLLGSSFGRFATNQTFDYVIVGGGTAGLTLADRLTQNGSLSVAVVEAGSFYEITNSNLSQIPAFDFFYTSSATTGIQPLIDWGIITSPQAQLKNRELHYAQGKCFGGGICRLIAHTYEVSTRGSAGSYQQWADQVDDQSFNFSNILPFFQKSVTFTAPDLAKRGDGGPVLFDPSAYSPSGKPLQVSYANYWAPIATFLRNAFGSLGLQTIAGFNSGNLIGCSEFTSAIDPQAATRSSSETAFLQASITRSNLMLYQQTLANRILFENKMAVGVSVSTAGVPFVLSATKEVILSAGVFRSPQILMISGIGPAETLQSLDIPVISDLQGVGQNLNDQPYYGVSVRVNVTTQSALFSDPNFAAQATSDFLDQQKGPLTLPGGSVAAFEKLPQDLRNNLSNATVAELSKFPSDWPELEILPLGSTTAETNDTANYMELSIAVLTTTSRGNVTINSTNASDNPIVSPNWLLTTADQELAVQGFKRARQVIASAGISVGPEFSPGPSVQTDSEILEYIKETIAPIHHASATNAMGKSGDSAAVVDTQGRVFGVSSLRVIDVSIFPFLPPGHPQATVYMLAEKLADDILDG
ncbi:Dehydrogenase [Lachnellula willkommii]|uniref:Dehydrogenase n=1 Tax=Lachnellula willkommii TaxID=215461 RepID=A0A559MFU8_9HELO|nr:Dehydrogenase [Lachnellula willkommii]